MEARGSESLRPFHCNQWGHAQMQLAAVNRMLVVVVARVRETTERQEADDDSDEDNPSAATVSLFTVRERMWRAFENPHTSIPALVFYYVTGYFFIRTLVGLLFIHASRRLSDAPPLSSDLS